MSIVPNETWQMIAPYPTWPRSLPFKDDPELVTLTAVSLAIATVSVLLAAVAFYWFVRMRRGFHHDLIMLLIQSDMLKALWLVICPIVLLANTELRSNTVFCQVSGFFLTATVESCDVAVLVIAVHASLSAIVPANPSGETGLYPYRRYLYCLGFVIPIILAAVVPMTKGRFADNGAYCYLPMNPGWYRKHLSWTPRYIVLLSIILAYAGVILHVRLRFRSFDNSIISPQRRRSQEGLATPRSLNSSQKVPDSGVSAVLLRSNAENLSHSKRETQSNIAVPSHITHSRRRSYVSFAEPSGVKGRTERRRPDRKSPFRWKTVEFNQDSPVEPLKPSRSPTQSRAEFMSGDSTEMSDVSPHDGPSISFHEMPSSSDDKRSSRGSQNRETFWRRSVAITHGVQGESGMQNEMIDMLSVLRSGPGDASSMQSRPARIQRDMALSPRSRQDSRGGTHDRGSLMQQLPTSTNSSAERRKTTQRNLPLLFVYPVVYFATWISPFVSHVLGYDDFEANPGQPFALQIASLASFCIGAAADSLFFIVREQPWRHRKDTFGGGMMQRVHSWREAWTRVPFAGRRQGMGRSREETDRDQRSAQSRRAREIRRDQADADDARALSPPVRREWWDIFDSVDDTDVSDGAAEAMSLGYLSAGDDNDDPGASGRRRQRFALASFSVPGATSPVEGGDEEKGEGIDRNDMARRSLPRNKRSV